MGPTVTSKPLQTFNGRQFCHEIAAYDSDHIYLAMGINNL